MTKNYKEFAIENLKNRKIFKETSFAKMHVGKKECYFSYFIFDEKADYSTIFEDTNEIISSDYLILDLDCKNSQNEPNLHQAFKQLKEFIKHLIDFYSLNPNEILINFSGYKGFHIRLHNSLFGGFPKSNNLPKIHKEISSILTKDFQSFDLIIYNKYRLIRIPETINEKSNKKASFIPTNTIIQTNSLEEISSILNNSDIPSEETIIDSFFNDKFFFQPNKKLVELKESVINNKTSQTVSDKYNKINTTSVNEILTNYHKLNHISKNCTVTQEILNKAVVGEHLDNKERLFIASILLNIYPDNDHLIHDILRNQENYDYEITDKKFKEIKSLNYSPFNCHSICGKNICYNAKKNKYYSPTDSLKISSRFNQSTFVYEFTNFHKHKLLYNHISDSFFFHSNGYFQKYSENQIAHLIIHYIKEYGDIKSISEREIQGIIKRLKMEADIHFNAKFNRDKFFLNLKNGVLNLKTKEFLPHDPKYLFSYQFDVDYEPNAQCPLYQKTLNEIFNNDQDIINFFLDWQCYSLIYDYNYQKLLILFGKGRNGKSLLLNVLISIIGRDNVASEKLQDLANDSGYSLVSLKDKFLNISQELSGKEIEVDIIKQITGGDLISARPIYKERIQFTNKARLIIATNILPRITNFDQALFHRIDFIEFPNSFCQNPDTNLQVKLESELSGIFNLIISRFNHITQNDDSIKIQTPQKSLTLLERRIGAFNSVLEWFYECCEINDDLENSVVSLKEAYIHYSQWCDDSGNKKLSKSNFKKILEDHYKLRIENTAYFKTDKTTYKNQILIYGIEIHSISDNSIPFKTQSIYNN